MEYNNQSKLLEVILFDIDSNPPSHALSCLQAYFKWNPMMLWKKCLSHIIHVAFSNYLFNPHLNKLRLYILLYLDTRQILSITSCVTVTVTTTVILPTLLQTFIDLITNFYQPYYKILLTWLLLLTQLDYKLLLTTLQNLVELMTDLY